MQKQLSDKVSYSNFNMTHDVVLDDGSTIGYKKVRFVSKDSSPGHLYHKEEESRILNGKVVSHITEKSCDQEPLTKIETTLSKPNRIAKFLKRWSQKWNPILSYKTL